MVRAGIIPSTAPAQIDTRVGHIDTISKADTADFDHFDSDDKGAVPLVKDYSIHSGQSDTGAQKIPVSMGSSVVPGGPAGLAGTESSKFSRITARPKRPDSFAPLCSMQAPAELELVQPIHFEPPAGTKEDLAIHGWEETEFGAFWWQQTDEHLVENSIWVQSESMREQGEFLHWYRVRPVDQEIDNQFMSARSGPEACIKVERSSGRGWGAIMGIHGS
jgi:hypothetical protein